ncbi:MAG: hypothetical protein KME30_29930 [Iphinoe sp. HA4291-MV1]|jgi:hypothetical protein|nr:hypothetical protein [Iphinoe sp. HA4291-MV1]
MRLTENQDYEIEYKNYRITINKPTKNTYAYRIRGVDVEDSEGGFKTAKSALLRAKNFIDES